MTLKTSILSCARVSFNAAFIFVAVAGFAGTRPPAEYPRLEIREEAGATNVFCNDQLLVEVKANRFLRFRASPEDDLWVGSEKSGADLGWVYRDPGAQGLDVLGVRHEQSRAKGEFTLHITGRKPQFESRVEAILSGRWQPDLAKFKYLLALKLQAPLEQWYENSKFQQRGLPSTGSQLWTEVLDYCIEGVTITERMLSPNAKQRKQPQLYDWFVKSHDGVNWEKWPKIHIPFPVRPGDYITIRDRVNPTREGGYYGFLDGRTGGWMTRITKTPAPVVYELCWSRFDVHMLLEGAIPPRHSASELSLDFAMEFDPIAPTRAKEIVDRAVEPAWRDAPEYQNLPLFSWNNRFDQVITDLPSEKTSNQTLWWASGYDCFRDDTTGYDDHYSVSIKRNTATTKASAWTTLSWAHPFNERPKSNRRFRMTAMVKTRDCTGMVRLAHYSSIANVGDMYYGGRFTHQKDGTKKTDGLVWEYSKSVSGTTDWTLVTLEFVVRHHGSNLVLEHTGTGQCWFDNVRIEDLGKEASDATR
jgi:hypothetical protein